MARILRGNGGEENCIFFALSDGTIIGGTGITGTEKLWNLIPEHKEAFCETEWIDKNNFCHTEKPMFSVNKSDTMHARMDAFDIIQKFTVISENRIRADIKCKVKDSEILLSKIMSGIYFFPKKKIRRAYDCLDFAWTPSLHHTQEDVCGHHFFRSPVVCVASKGYYLAIVPSLNEFQKDNNLPFALDLRSLDSTIEGPRLSYGVCTWEPVPHVYTVHSHKKEVITPVEFSFSYDILLGDYQALPEVLKIVQNFLWNKYGNRWFADIRPQVMPFEDYGRKYTYIYELQDSLKKRVINGKNCAGINNISRRGSNFHAWENDLLMAYGMKYYSIKWKDSSLEEIAEGIRNLFLSAPQSHGAFPCIYNFETDCYEGSLFWTARAIDPIKGFDSAAMSVTVWWAMLWCEDLDDCPEMMSKVERYLNFLSSKQETNGAIPTYFDSDLTPAEQLRFSATTGLNGAVLAKGARLTGNAEWKDVALEAGRFIKNTIIPSLDFSDFEAYYSCSPKPLYFMDNETGIKPHCNLSIQWCCDLMLELYRLTGDKNWLDDGEYLLNIMCLYQQIWDPPFYPEYLYGGFGVMNTDGEWNDGRQSRFVVTLVEYFEETKNLQYLKRAVAACRASFALMDIPENHDGNINQLVLGKQFAKGDAGCGKAVPGVGYAPENIHHPGFESTKAPNQYTCWTGLGWSSGGALSGSAYLDCHIGSAYLDIDELEVIGIDGLQGEFTGSTEVFISSAVKASSRQVTLRTSKPIQLKVNGIDIIFSEINDCCASIWLGC